MRTYKFRAESMGDVITFLEAVLDTLANVESFSAKRMSIEMKNKSTIAIPDVEVEITCDCTLPQLQRVALSLSDCHVIAETLALKENYTGERRPFQPRAGRGR